MSTRAIRTNPNVDGPAVVQEALGLILPRVADASRRRFLRGTLTLGGVAMLGGCSITDDSHVEAALVSISRFNDHVQGWLFDPTRLAPTYPETMITRPFPFNAYYGEDEVRQVDGDAWRLAITGLVADRRRWSLAELRTLPQAVQVTRHICVEGWSAIRPDGEVRRLPLRRRLPHQHRHGHGPAPADDPRARLGRRAAAAEVRLPGQAAHADQARLQEPEAHPHRGGDQHLPRRLLGRPGLQLVRRQLSWHLTSSRIPHRFQPAPRGNHPGRPTMNKLATLLLSACLATAGSAFAQDAMKKDEMAKDTMKKDTMGKDAMAKDGMKKDAMAKDAMGKDAMKKDAMGKDAMAKDGMHKDAMAKDAMKKDEMKK
jgi:pentapeptide MXKDX repeat protein